MKDLSAALKRIAELESELKASKSLLDMIWNSPMSSGMPKNIRRLLVFHRDKGICRYCKEHIPFGRRGTVDHIVPKAKGGRENLNNLAWTCKDCNEAKGARDLAEFVEAVKTGAIVVVKREDNLIYVPPEGTPPPPTNKQKIAMAAKKLKLYAKELES